MKVTLKHNINTNNANTYDNSTKPILITNCNTMIAIATDTQIKKITTQLF